MNWWGCVIAKCLGSYYQIRYLECVIRMHIHIYKQSNKTDMWVTWKSLMENFRYIYLVLVDMTF